MGDCDNDNECMDGTTCVQNSGAVIGYDPNLDLCLATTCSLPFGDAEYCSQCGPCGAGEGDCDGDAECGTGMVCADNVGANYGLPGNYDVCESSGCSLPVGDAAYCTQCGPCTAGQGDCDGNDECATGLTCADNVGTDYGLPGNYEYLWSTGETISQIEIDRPGTYSVAVTFQNGCSSVRTITVLPSKVP